MFYFTCDRSLTSESDRDQQRFTISKVASDWHELMIPRRIMRPSIAYTLAKDWTRGGAH